MYRGPWRALPDCTFIDWPIYAGEESIKAIAKRVVAEAKIPNDAVLVGSSLGGIVACEVTKIRKIKRLVLVGSAKKKEEISRLLSTIHPLINFAPIEFIQFAAGKLPSEITQMFSRSQADFIRAMCWAIFEWDGLDETLVELRRIHGRSDRVIPLPEDVDKVVDGGHLIAMTHAQECVDFVRAQFSYKSSIR